MKSTINDIIHEKRYDSQMIKYMRTLTKDPPIDPNIAQYVIKSVINQTATFLNKQCPRCSVCVLVDPTGLRSRKYAMCGNCGYTL